EILMKHLTARPDLSPLPEPYRTIVGKAMAKDPAHRPSRVYDLLVPEDAPKTPKVRFIGEKNPPRSPESGPALAEEDVLRIGIAEPVFSIGPDTRPPVRRGGALAARYWAVAPLIQQARLRIRNRGAAVRPVPAVRRPAPPKAAPPPVLPPLPSPRV